MSHSISTHSTQPSLLNAQKTNNVGYKSKCHAMASAVKQAPANTQRFVADAKDAAITRASNTNKLIQNRVISLCNAVKSIFNTIVTETCNTVRRAVIGGGSAGLIGGALAAAVTVAALSSNPLIGIPVAVGVAVVATGSFTITGATVGATLPITKWILNTVSEKSKQIISLSKDLNSARLKIKELEAEIEKLSV